MRIQASVDRPGDTSRWIGQPIADAHPELNELAGLMAGRVPLASMPTPLQRADRLSEHLGREIWLKRDDLTGTGLGGNKIRKLELLTAQARVEGADTLVSAGAPQSNHARSVAAAAAMLRMECHLVLAGNAPAAPSGNLLLDALFGAELHWAETTDWVELGRATDAVAAALERTGRRVFATPVGGSVPLGSTSFVAAYLELLAQCADVGLAPSVVMHASSSGGTQAGLHLGSIVAEALLGGGPRVVGVDVAKITDPLAETVNTLAAQTAQLLGLGGLWREHARMPEVLTGYLGEGYAIPSGGSTAALQLLARLEGVLLDPVYSAKGFQAACEFEAEGPLVFWHTGGTPALFADGH